MNREIKFRAWVDSMKKMHIWGVNLISINHDLSWESLSDGMFDKNDSILMQFIGLKDNKGIEIYDGDKLNGLHGFTWVVSWNDNHACFQVTSGNIVAEVIDNDNMEVIGNIYQNP